MDIAKVFLKKLRAVKMNPSQAIVLGFLALIIVGAVLLSLPIASEDGNGLDFISSLFTATTATCVTGLAVVDTATQFSTFGEMVILALIQIGGLGFMTFGTFVFLLLGKKIGLRNRLFLQESLNQFTLSGLVRLTKSVFFTTFILEGIGALILGIRFSFDMPAGQAAYYGIFHSISAFCNAGIDLFGAVSGPFTSITSYASDWLVTGTVMTLIVLGGLGFPVIIDLVRSLKTRKIKWSLHTKLVITVTSILIAVGTLTFFVLEFNNPNTLGPLSFSNKVLSSLFHSISPRTAGFNTLDISQFRIATLLLTIILMFIGASPSSTGGGIKTTTFGVLLASVHSTIKGYDETVIHRKRMSNDVIMKAITITCLALFLVIFSSMVLSITENVDFMSILFEVTSAFGTVGLSTGITPSLSHVGRVLIIILMFIGRLGPMTVGVALTQKNKKSVFHYPEEKVIIG